MPGSDILIVKLSASTTLATFQDPLAHVAPPTESIVTKSFTDNPCAVLVIVATPSARATPVIFVADASSLSSAFTKATSNIEYHIAVTLACTNPSSTSILSESTVHPEALLIM